MRDDLSEAELTLLVLRSQDGDRDALDRLIREFQRPLLAYLLRRCGDASLAADLSQETLLRAVRDLSALREPAAFGAWLMASARRRVADHFRGRPPAAGGDAVGDVAAPVDAGPPETDDLTRCVDRLPPAQREAVRLYYFEDLPVAAVAAAAGVSEGTVKSRLHHARRKLHSALRRLRAAAGDEPGEPS